MTKRYELIREIFNQCSGNQMRDVDVTEVACDDPDEVVARYRTGKDIQEERTVAPDGDIIYELYVDGLHQRLSFTEI